MFNVDLSLTTVLLIIQSFILIPSVVELKYHKFRYSDFTSDINVTMCMREGERTSRTFDKIKPAFFRDTDFFHTHQPTVNEGKRVVFYVISIAVI